MVLTDGQSEKKIATTTEAKKIAKKSLEKRDG